MTDLLKCSTCQEHKPDDAFQRNRSCAHRRGRGWRCRQCASTVDKARRQGRVGMDAFYRRTYGISMDEFEGMRWVQDSRCALCDEPTDRLCVDHDHDTGVVRGLLCTPCNVALGKFGDNLDGLKRAVRYLEEAPA